jgi:hypothetical protein
VSFDEDGFNYYDDVIMAGLSVLCREEQSKSSHSCHCSMSITLLPAFQKPGVWQGDVWGGVNLFTLYSQPALKSPRALFGEWRARLLFRAQAVSKCHQ